jgi:5-hydroxyisourate hydrolase-like protein (transthyretin family)
MINKILSGLLLLLTLGCISGPSPVNTGPSRTVLPSSSITNDYDRHKQLQDDASKQTPEAAIAGTVMTSDRIAIPVSRILIGLYILENGTWTEVTRMTTEIDGKFSITRRLYSGTYDVRSLDPRYKGKVGLTLVSSPVLNLILSVSK